MGAIAIQGLRLRRNPANTGDEAPKEWFGLSEGLRVSKSPSRKEDHGISGFKNGDFDGAEFKRVSCDFPAILAHVAHGSRGGFAFRFGQPHLIGGPGLNPGTYCGFIAAYHHLKWDLLRQLVIRQVRSQLIGVNCIWQRFRFDFWLGQKFERYPFKALRLCGFFQALLQSRDIVFEWDPFEYFESCELSLLMLNIGAIRLLVSDHQILLVKKVF